METLIRWDGGWWACLGVGQTTWHEARMVSSSGECLLHLRLHSALFFCFHTIFFPGIESMRAGHYQIGYTCFKLAADRGYSKAQFNVGLCYEHGRGTEKDLEKVSTACTAMYMCGTREAVFTGCARTFLPLNGCDSLWSLTGKCWK